jgi:hypothetical protein
MIARNRAIVLRSITNPEYTTSDLVVTIHVGTGERKSGVAISPGSGIWNTTVALDPYCKNVTDLIAASEQIFARMAIELIEKQHPITAARLLIQLGPNFKSAEHTISQERMLTLLADLVKAERVGRMVYDLGDAETENYVYIPVHARVLLNASVDTVASCPMETHIL